jgi:MFS-type transporter involved in bile tolerance (Atg22 family)
VNKVNNKMNENQEMLFFIHSQYLVAHEKGFHNDLKMYVHVYTCSMCVFFIPMA